MEAVGNRSVTLDFNKVWECCGEGRESRFYEVNGVDGVTHLYFKRAEEGKVWLCVRTDMGDHSLEVLPSGEVQCLNVLPEWVDLEAVFDSMGLQISGKIVGESGRYLDVKKGIGVAEAICEQLAAQVATCTLDADLVAKYICEGVEVGIDRDGHYYLMVDNVQDSEQARALRLTEENDGGGDLVAYGKARPTAHGVAFNDLENFQLFLELFRSNL